VGSKVKARRAEFIVIGGGLSGLISADTLSRRGAEVVLLDRSLPDGNGSLGGFTGFSGAKFSLLPAGQGLVPVAGSLERLHEAIDDVLRLLRIRSRVESGAGDISADEPLGGAGAIRRYQSIVLTPSEIAETIKVVSERVRESVQVIAAKATNLRFEGQEWVVSSSDGELWRAPSVLFAAGRTGASLLRDAGATLQEGKGVDLGVRIEFLDRSALHRLREKGPDAKILMGRTRTFCLNHPGTIYRYPFRDISIPGGIVGHRDEQRANFGILTRVTQKQATIDRVLHCLGKLGPAGYEIAPTVRGPPFQDKLPTLRATYGEAVAGELQAFAEMLGKSELVDFDQLHKVHFPLLDWHWDTFAVGTTHRTDRPGLYVAGDAAGHARGLLQAGVSGWLAAQEMLSDADK